MRLRIDLAGAVLLGLGLTLALDARAIPAGLVLAAAAAVGLVLLPSRGWRFGAALVVGAAWLGHHGPWGSRLTSDLAAAGFALVTAGLIFAASRSSRRWVWASCAAAGLVLATGLGSEPVPAGNHQDASPVAPISRSRIDAAASYLRSQVAAAQVPGAAVVVVQGDRIVASAASGRNADGTPMTAQTPVVIGSTTKSITALAVYQLVETGKVTLDSPVSRYLSWYSPIDPRARDITVRQLLLDTSGITTWAGWKALAGDGTTDPAAVRALVNRIRLSESPGAKFQYSNANYIILGQVIEAVSGQSFSDYVEQHILGPLGMINAKAGPSPQAATGHRFWLGYPIASTLPFLRIAVPAGYLTASAMDLGRYVGAHLNGGQFEGVRVLSEVATADLHRPEVRAVGFGTPPGGRSYAMGWYVGTVAGSPAIFHSGDTFDSSSALVMIPALDLGVALVANSESVLVPIAKTLADGVTAELLGRPASDISTKLATTELEAAALMSLVAGFAVNRARRLLATGTWSTRSLVRIAAVDLVVPAALVVVPPILFGHVLDRLESVGPLDFWRIAYRGLPDVTLVVLGALALRFLTGAWSLGRALLPLRSAPRSAVVAA